MCALYAFLRTTDDLADGPGNLEGKRNALARWQLQLEQALAGRYSHRLHAAFHDTMAVNAIPREYVEALFEGVGMDLALVRYATFHELYGYCYRVASIVGLSCIHIWGFQDSRAKAFAESAGIGFQLTNILRDLGEDSARGRIYLPQEDLERFGYSTERLCRGERDQRFCELMRFQVLRARSFYDASSGLSALLAPPGRAVFTIMSRTYRALLDAIERRNYDVFSSRVSLGPFVKLGFVVQALPIRLGWT
jgi:phytoene synthase